MEVGRLAPGRYDTTQYKNVFVTTGDDYSIRHRAEGSAYTMGIPQALAAWRRLLRSAGFLVLTEVVWLKPDPPEEIFRYWTEEEGYPAISDAARKLAMMDKAAYRVVTHFTLPRTAWWQNYSQPMGTAVEAMLARHPEVEEARTVAAALRREIGMYQRYGEWYGYEFFILTPKS